MIDRLTAQQVLEKALESGGDFAELYADDTSTNFLRLTNGRVEGCSSGRDRGAGVRVFKGVFTVYVYTNDLSLEGLLSCAVQAAEAIGHLGEACPQVALATRIFSNIHPVLVHPLDVEAKKKADFLRKVDKSARAAAQEILQVDATLRQEDQEVLIANTEGVYTRDHRVYTRLFAHVTAGENGQMQTATRSVGGLCGLELIEKTDVEAMGKAAATSAMTMLRAPYMPGGNMPVVIGNGFGGVIFHEACGHALETTTVGKGTSVFSGKLGQRIASPCVTAVDDGTIPGAWGSINIDDEGTPATRLVLIEKGILKNYMVDRLGSRRIGMPMTGSGRRQNYRFAAASRMRNTFIDAGSDKQEEMIATMGDGLYAAKMGGGSVNPSTGEFNFSVLEGYKVKDGKIAHAVRGATLIGKGQEVLERIDRVGSDLVHEPGMCGSVSGQVHTNVGQPVIRVSQMTVGGR